MRWHLSNNKYVIRAQYGLGGLLWFIYCLLTIFTVLPVSPIRAKLEYWYLFDLFKMRFEQNWTFFTPPLKGNILIVYDFWEYSSESKNTKPCDYSIEVVSETNAAKRRDPFAFGTEVSSYIVEGSALVTQNLFVEIRKFLTLELGRVPTDDELKAEIDKNEQNFGSLQTLYGYSNVVINEVVRRGGRKPASYRFRILRQETPKFINRKQLVDPTYSPQIVMIFESRVRDVVNSSSMSQ